MLNRIWISFFLIAFFFACLQAFAFGNTGIFQEMTKSTFDTSKTAFELALGLTGVMSLWLGIMKIGENGGAVHLLSRIIGPVIHRLFPDIPKNHAAVGSIIMNFSANILGLDNAATPLGLKAMKELQELNPNKETASNAQIMFLVLNTSALTLIPVSIMVYRAQHYDGFGSAQDPTDIFIPILITTFCSSLAGLLSVSIYQRLNLFNKEILLFIGLVASVITCIIFYFTSLSQSAVEETSSLWANFLLIAIITAFIALAAYKKTNVYESFIDGAKEGFQISVQIIPYLVAMLVAIAVFRSSGAMDYLINGISWVVEAFGLNSDFTPALPTALMKPLSGSGARGLMVDAMTTYGPDSFVGRLTSIMQGSTDTTFYIIAVYFGSVGIKKTRHAITCGLIADGTGMIVAIAVAYLFFH